MPFDSLIHPLSGLAVLYHHLGDMSAYDIDGPVPEIDDPNHRSISSNVMAVVRRDNLSIRQLYQLISAGNTGRYIIGTPADVVDDMQEWMEAGAADGFNLCPPTLPQGIEDFVELVLPELHKRDLFRREYEGATLRENLGLKPLVHPARASRVLKAS